MCIRNLIRLWCPCEEEVHYETEDDHTIRPDSWEAFPRHALGHVIVRSIDTGAYKRCEDYLAKHGFNLSGYPTVPICSTGEFEDASTHFQYRRFCDECVSTGCPAVWKPERRYGFKTTKQQHAAHRLNNQRQTAARAPIKRAQLEAQAAWREAREPLRTIDLVAEDRADIARAKKARSMAALLRSWDKAAGIAPTCTTGAKTAAGSSSSACRRVRSTAKGPVWVPGRRTFSSVASSFSDDGDDDSTTISAPSTSPSLLDSLSAAGSPPASPSPAGILRDRLRKRYTERALCEEAEKSSRGKSTRSGASIVSWIADVAAASGEEASSVNDEEQNGSGDLGVEHSPEEVAGVQILDWDDGAESVTSGQTPAVEEAAMSPSEGTSWLSDDSTSLRSTDDEDGYEADLDVSLNTISTPSCSSDKDTSSANTALSTPTVLLSADFPPLPRQDSNTGTLPEPKQQLSAKARGKLRTTANNSPTDCDIANRRARKLARYKEQGRLDMVARVERLMAVDGVRPTKEEEEGAGECERGL